MGIAFGKPKATKGKSVRREKSNKDDSRLTDFPALLRHSATRRQAKFTVVNIFLYHYALKPS